MNKIIIFDMQDKILIEIYYYMNYKFYKLGILKFNILDQI